MSRKRHNYKNLKIWMLGIEITYDVFKIIDDFPKEEKFGLASQISRCSISIPSNIAEGSSRTDKSFSHFLDISLGSSFELETQLIIAGKRKYISKEQLNKIEDKNQKPAEDKLIDSTKVTNEIEYFLKEINDMKNKMVNMEQDIISLKEVNKKISIGIEEAKSNTKNEIPKDKYSEMNEEMKMKMKTLNEKRIKGIIEKYSVGDLLLFGCILLFLIGAVITFRNIFFKSNKSIPAADHPKV